eukprot:442978_1
MRNKHEVLKEETAINLTLTTPDGVDNFNIIETEIEKKKYPKTPPAKVTIAKQQTRVRWCILAVLCIAIYSFVYCYDNPFAIQNQLIDDYGLSMIQYNLLYSIYGYINMIAPFFAALIVDYIGINSSTLIFQIFIVFGQTLFVIACFPNIKSFPLKLIGRSIFGIGAEQFHLSRKWLLYQYFTGTEYYFASGLSLSFSRFGSASQSYISTVMYNKHNSVVAVLSIGWILVILSLILLIILLYIQKKYYTNINNQTDVENTYTDTNIINTDIDNNKQFHLLELFKGGYDKRWWLLGFVLIFFYSTYLAYSNVGSAFLQNRYKFTYEEGNSLAPIMFWIAAIFTPIYGILCDVYGKRTLFMISAAVSLLLGHIFLGIIGTADKSIGIPICGLIFLGNGYSLGAAAIWPSFGLIVEQKYLATTLGIWGCIDNAFQASSFVIIGALTKSYNEEERELYYDQYDNCTYFWIALALGTLLWTISLWYYDATMFDNVLWIPSEKFAKGKDKQKMNYEHVETYANDKEIN